MSRITNTRQLIIETATELFMSQGYLATSTRQIALEVGITQPNLYSHFRNKEAVYLAVFEHLSKDVSENLGKIVKSNEINPETKLKQMVLELKKKHPFDLNMMMHDIESELSESSRKQLFIIWQEAYFQPFLTFFQNEQQVLKQSLTPELAVNHFLNALAPYIRKNDHNLLSIEQVVDFYLYGVWKEPEKEK